MSFCVIAHLVANLVLYENKHLHIISGNIYRASDEVRSEDGQELYSSAEGRFSREDKQGRIDVAEQY